MFDILRTPDDIKIICDSENTDAVVRTELADRKLKVYIKATETEPKYICARWNCRIDKPTRVMGDAWERSYGDLKWQSLNGECFMPWYFIANYEDETVGCGVMVQPNSFVCFQADASGVTAWFDVRNGGVGVKLSGRELLAATVVCEHYKGISAFSAAKEFCKVMSPSPRLPKQPVYGSNNWYYAYGKSSKEDIIGDARIIAELTKGIENRPFMVVDEGWEVGSCGGPWDVNDKFSDMKVIAEEFKKLNVKPGIWIRPLCDARFETEHPELRMHAVKDNRIVAHLDPTRPEVKEHFYNLISTIREWGYQLIKHDFSTFDIFGNYGFSLNGSITNIDDLYFYDRTKTSAEIVLDFYKLIREAAGDMIIIGCNTVSHLCAGLVEVNRIGDDTSGKSWSRTRAIGVNTLAFRLCQNNSFYVVDADCVGVIEGKIPWKLNKQWLHLLANTGSPLFVSLQPSALTDEMKKDLAEAMKINAEQKDIAEPVDWLYNNQPQTWCINGEITEYDFVMDSYPALTKSNIQPY